MSLASHQYGGSWIVTQDCNPSFYALGAPVVFLGTQGIVIDLDLLGEGYYDEELPMHWEVA